MPTLPEDIADKIFITELLGRYTRAIDTADREGVAAVFAPGATVKYAMIDREFESGDDFAAFAAEGLATMKATHHLIGNIAIEVDGDRATSKAYATAQHIMSDDTFTTLGGEYRDVLTRTADGGWLIAEREFVCFWVVSGPTGVETQPS